MLIEVARQDCANLDKASFERDHVLKEVPLVIAAGCKGWPASSKWNLAYFRNAHGEIRVPVSRYPSKGNEAPKQKLVMTIADLMTMYERHESSAQNQDPEQYYLAGWHYAKAAPSLLDDIEIPDVFSDNLLPYVNDNIIHYDWSSLFVGHRDTATPNHTDSFYVAVWLALIQGRKTLRYVSSQFHSEMASGLDLFDEDIMGGLDGKGIDIYQAEIVSGDIAYHPPGWWHQVRNHSFNIAVSNNYVNEKNYLPFKQQLLAKAVLPIFSNLSDLDTKFGLEQKYSADIEANTSRMNIKSSKYVENQSKINAFLTEYVRSEELILKGLSASYGI